LKIRAGYDIAFECSKDVPLVLMLSVHPSRQADLLRPHRIHFLPDVSAENYTDMFGNICTRLVAPAGLIEISNEFVIKDSGLPDAAAVDASQAAVAELPDDTLVYLLGSRYCDTQKLSDLAWSLFG